MPIKTVEMVRKIRDEYYQEMKGLSIKEQIKFIKEKAEQLQKSLKRKQCSTADNTEFATLKLNFLARV